MSGKRRSYEAGHRPKFLVVVDETPECARAIHFASRRAARTGASMLMLSIVEPPANFEWLGVGEAMIEEARKAAEKRLEEAARETRTAAGVEPEQVIRIGESADTIVKLIDEDEDISFLVLAAGTGKDGPGPLVSSLASRVASTFPVPIVVVPGSLSDEEIDALAG
ncbi:universal stress protein [Microvirga flavescens]|uniref:universal stress protein n=1 Tax=Microvirga flavescens TaxID=2249811 RepID=UPI000DD8BCC6|nr:universal stress protein [Microvirga flavescens]